jgi:hypothetical protein
MSLLLAVSLLGLVKSVLIALLAVLNAILAAIATVAVWKTYLAIGVKVGLIVLFCIPVVGVVLYLAWGRRKVREAQPPPSS